MPVVEGDETGVKASNMRVGFNAGFSCDSDLLGATMTGVGLSPGGSEGDVGDVTEV